MRDQDITLELPASVKTGRLIEEVSTRSQVSSQQLPKQASSRQTPVPEKGREAPWLRSFYPQMATLMTHVPEGKDWLYEIKFDGYRLLAQIKRGRVVLMTRRAQDWTEKFKSIAEQLARLPLQNGILDGEVVVQNPDGTVDFKSYRTFCIKGERAHSSIMFSICPT